MTIMLYSHIPGSPDMICQNIVCTIYDTIELAQADLILRGIDMNNIAIVTTQCNPVPKPTDLKIRKNSHQLYTTITKIINRWVTLVLCPGTEQIKCAVYLSTRSIDGKVFVHMISDYFTKQYPGNEVSQCSLVTNSMLISTQLRQVSRLFERIGMTTRRIIPLTTYYISKFPNKVVKGVDRIIQYMLINRDRVIESTKLQLCIPNNVDELVTTEPLDQSSEETIEE